MTAPTKSLTDNANDSDEEIRVSGAPERQQGQKPRLLVEDCNPDCTLAARVTFSLQPAGSMIVACPCGSLSTKYNGVQWRR